MKIVFCIVLALSGAPSLGAAQDSRHAQVAEMRAEKARKLRPHKRGKAEAAIRKIEDDLVAERLAQSAERAVSAAGWTGRRFRFWRRPGVPDEQPPGNPHVVFNVSGAVSLRSYWIGEASLAFPRIASGQVFAELYGRKRDFPQEDFFGIGANSSVEDRTNFALRDTAIRGTAGVKPAQWLAIGGGVEHLSPSIGRGTDTRFPSTEQLFSDAGAPGFDVQPDFFRYEGFVDIDYRDTIPGLSAASDRLDWPLVGNPRTGGRYTCLQPLRRSRPGSLLVQPDRGRCATVYSHA